jgi:ERCC4-type nuclease
MILVDEREKKPFTFPEHIVCLDPTKEPWAQRGVTIRLRTQKRTLKTGDYAIDGSNCVVERKGSINEITQNLLTQDGRRRFSDCCKRLRDTTSRSSSLRGWWGCRKSRPESRIRVLR